MGNVDVDATFSRPLLEDAIRHIEQALDGDPLNTVYRLTLAEAQLAARQNTEALDTLRGAREPMDGNRAIWMESLAAFRLGDSDLAAELLSRLDDERELGFTRYHSLWGSIHYDQGEYDESVNSFARARLLHPEPNRLSFLMARSLVAFAETQSTDTNSLYRRALSLLGSLSPEPSQADEWHFLEGRSHLALGYPAEALRHFERSRTPDDHHKSVLAGLAYLLMGHRDLALGFLQHGARGEHRKLLAGYLAEIAAASRDDLRAMRSGDRADSEVTLDRYFLATIFGDTAQEVEDIITASTRWRENPMDRTQLEESLSFARGRLLALDDAPLPIHGADPIGPETLRSVSSEDETTAHWKPQTLLDTGAAIDDTKETEVFPSPGNPDNDDWDIDS